MEAACEEAETEGALDLLGIAFPAPDVQHRGDAASELGRDGTLVQFYIVDNVRVESGEQAEEVAGVVDGSVVEEHQVLVGGAAADVESA